VRRYVDQPTKDYSPSAPAYRLRRRQHGHRRIVCAAAAIRARSADAWDGQLLFLAQHGFRVVAHDRRGHGRSSQPSFGNDMNGYADDLAAVIEALNLTDATPVGHSTARA
jgi:pimeloyl-ACP methyl ester carboxylesterase